MRENMLCETIHTLVLHNMYRLALTLNLHHQSAAEDEKPLHESNVKVQKEQWRIWVRILEVGGGVMPYPAILILRGGGCWW